MAIIVSVMILMAMMGIRMRVRMMPVEEANVLLHPNLDAQEQYSRK